MASAAKIPLVCSFRHDVLRSDFKPNPDSQTAERSRSLPQKPAAERIAEAVAADPYSIGYTSAPKSAENEGLAADDGQLANSVTVGSIGCKSPTMRWTRSVWVYFRRMPDEPIDSKVDGFVRYLLSGPRAVCAAKSR